jgi:hypothetical protein
MNDSIRVMRRAWPSPARIAAVVAVTAALALLTAACSGGGPSATGSPHTGRSANSSSAVAFSRCMRSHGMPGYPDPSGSGALPKTSPQRLGVSSAQFNAAQRTCQHLLPSTASVQQQTQQCMLTGDCPPALVRQILTAELNFARCMRSHGVPNWPDPSIDSEGRPDFNVSARGINPHHSPQINSKIGECQRLTPSPVPLG